MDVHNVSTPAFPKLGLDGYFFATPALRLRLDLIQEYVSRNASAVLILGESAVGKTTLLNQLICRADHSWRIVRMPAVLSFTAGDVMTFLCAELRMPTRVPAEQMLAALRTWLERLAMRGQIGVVVVDNAHNLNDESLSVLTTLGEKTQSDNFCVLMTGEPALRTRLTSLPGVDGSTGDIHAVNIPCLDEREVASYIDMRLYRAGLEGRGPFSRATIDDIARNSRGCPGRINAMANMLLSGEHKKLQWQRAAQRVRKLMRQCLTLADVAEPRANGR